MNFMSIRKAHWLFRCIFLHEYIYVLVIICSNFYFSGSKYEPVTLENNYKVHMKLTIHNVGPADFGSYKCVSKNSLGDTDGTIKLYCEYLEQIECFNIKYNVT